MRMFNFIYQGSASIDTARTRVEGTPAEHLLLQVFCGTPEQAYIAALLAQLQQAFPGVAILGITTAGEIMDGEQHEQTTVITVMAFSATCCSTALVTQNDDLFQAGQALAQALFQDDTTTCIVFACGIRDGVPMNGEPLMQGLKEANAQIIIAGGQAGDNGLGIASWVFTEQGITAHGVAAAALHGSQLRVRNSYKLGWVPIGKKMTITAAVGACIHSIDDQAAATIYRHYLGDEISARLPASAVDFPLVVLRDGILVARFANRINENGSLDYVSAFQVGEQVQFAFCHSGLLAEQAAQTHADHAAGNWEGVLLYSCVSRKWALGADIRIELADWPAIAPSAGFFGYGEYFHSAGQNHFLSQTLTLLALSEAEASSPRAPVVIPERYDSRQLQTLRVLHRLIETFSLEIETMNQRLRELAHQDALTGLANRRQLDAAVALELRRLRRSEKNLTCILLDVDYFKDYNDAYGHVHGDDCLRSIALVLQLATRRPGDLAARYGGEEFVVLLPDTDFEGGMHIAETLRVGLENLRIAHARSAVASVVTASFGLITVHNNCHDAPARLFELCDEQLYKAKAAGRNQVKGIDLANPTLSCGI